MSGNLSSELDCVADEDHAAGGAGNGALDQQDVAFGIALHDLEVLCGDLLVTHVTSHFHAFEDTGRKGALANGARLAMVLMSAVRGRCAPEIVPLHHASEALTSARGRDINLHAGGDLLDSQFLADFEAVDGVEAKFHEALAWLYASLLKVAGGRLVELISLL
jgi:hypothetical protein